MHIAHIPPDGMAREIGSWGGSMRYDIYMRIIYTYKKERERERERESQKRAQAQPRETTPALPSKRQFR